MSLSPVWDQKLQAARQAARDLRVAPSSIKNAVLLALEKLIQENETLILEENQKDLGQLQPDDSRFTDAFKDRLKITPARLTAIRESLRQVAHLPDPVGEEVEKRILANGLQVKRVRSPLGVIFMIFESRPNVAVEAFSLALKSGNALLLRGGKESQQTVTVFYSLMQKALTSQGLPSHCLVGVTDPDRNLVLELLQRNKEVDVVVPRGGDRLIEFVVEHSRIPIIKNDRGLCHVYLHEDANPSMATDIVTNAKTQRPGVCNSMETLLVHAHLAPQFLPALFHELTTVKKWWVCPRAHALLAGRPGVFLATPASFDTEYLDLEMSVRVVDGLDQALDHIERHGSRHSEAIVTQSEAVARTFQRQVDAAAVYWNASTRFTDGFELGLGGELGISTQKLHVRGPVGLRELTSVRWVMDGTGQTRK